jgi:hypothetical protein
MAIMDFRKGKSLKRFVPIVFFALFFVIGLSIFRDYGISMDEPVQYQHTLVNIKHIYKHFGINCPEKLQRYPNINDYGHKFYGTALQFIPALVDVFYGFDAPPSTTYAVRHLFTFSLFFIALISAYRIGRRLWKDHFIWALLVVVFLILSPRIFVESFYNIKDLAFMSVLLISVYGGMKWLDKPTSIVRIVFFASLSAISFNSRFIGMIVPLFVVFICFIRTIHSKQKIIPVLISIIACIGLTLFLLILITPASWSHPFTHFEDTIFVFSNYQGYDGFSLYRGNRIDMNHLPWHYLPVWMLVTTPVLYLVLFATGVLGQSIDCIFKKRFKTFFFDFRVIIYFLGLVPLILDILFRPKIYGGWRHFYFIYPYIILIAVDGLFYIYQNAYLLTRFVKKKVFVCAIGLIVGFSLCSTLFWMVKNHPYEYVYFSQPFRKTASMKFPRDNWNLSYKNQIEKLLKNADKYPIAFDVMVEYSGLQYRTFFSSQTENKFDFSSSPDYLIYPSISVKGDEWEVHRYHLLSTIKVDNFNVSALFEYDYKDIDFIPESGVLQRIDTISKEEGEWVVFQINTPDFDYDLIRLSRPYQRIYKRNMLRMSEDGIHWEKIPIEKLNRTDYQIQQEIRKEYRFLALFLPYFGYYSDIISPSLTYGKRYQNPVSCEISMARSY